MTYKNIGIKEETVLLLNRSRAILQQRNPKKRFYDDEVIYTVLNEFLYNNLEVKKCQKKKPYRLKPVPQKHTKK